MSKNYASRQFQQAPDLDVAFSFGFTDSLEGCSRFNGLNYYPLNSECWRSYESGYERGLEVKANLAGAVAQLRVNWRGGRYAQAV